MYQLNPASLDSDSNNKSESLFKKPSNNRTYKNRKSVKFDDVTCASDTKSKINNITNLLANLHNTTQDEDDNMDDNNFQSYSNIAKKNEQTQNQNQTSDPSPSPNNDIINSELKKMNMHADNNVGNAAYMGSNINNVLSNFDDSYKSNIEYINNVGTTTNMSTNESVLNNNNLLAKLDYIVHLLEEQRNEKTNYITEELILYLFLGIFMIFVLDSFARASKYVR